MAHYTCKKIFGVLHVMGLKCLIWLSCLYFVRYRDFIFGPFGLKLPIHAHFGEILADSIP